jgi:hypothetical protein
MGMGHFPKILEKKTWTYSGCDGWTTGAYGLLGVS